MKSCIFFKDIFVSVYHALDVLSHVHTVQPCTEGNGKNILLEIRTRDTRLGLKPALVQDTDYMFEKTYHIAPLFGRF